MQNRWLKVLIISMNGLAYFLPSVSAAISYNLWTKTHRYTQPKREFACYAAADKSFINFNQQNILVYHWGKGPKILLLHGWNGRATQLFQIVEQLVESGYQVLSVDQPGFGESSGSRSGLMPIRQLIEHLANTEGPFTAIVAHSFAWLAAINAKPGNITDSLIGIAPPSDFNWLLQGFGKYYQLNNRAINALKRKVCKRYQIRDLGEISIAQIGPQLNLPGLIVYDEDDDKIPIGQITQIRQAWNNCEIKSTKGLGHTRILYDKNVSKMVVEFINKLTNANH